MAWNPSKEVAVARDAAKALGDRVDRCIILYTTESGQIGYASYGKDRRLCEQAKQIGDSIYIAANKWFELQG
jgi:hypothetical protein